MNKVVYTSEFYFNLAIVLATIAGFLMVAVGAFLGVSSVAVSNNNNIGLEETKFLVEHNVTLQSYGDLNTLVIGNNRIATNFISITEIFSILAFVFGFLSVFLCFEGNKAKLREKS